MAVKPHGNGIQIAFKYGGKWYKPTWDQPPTTTNLRAAEKLRRRIVEEIRIGTFNFREYFPDYRGDVETDGITFKEVADIWLQTKANLKWASRKHYRNGAHYWNQHFEKRTLDSIRYSEIATILAQSGNGSITQAHWINVIKQIFHLAVADGVTQKDPTGPLKKPRTKKKTPPDPYSVEEVEVLIAKLRQLYPMTWHANYFEFCFFAGMRPSEVIAIEWGDVDFRKSTVRVEKAVFDGHAQDSTKTSVSRDVELCPRAIQALKRQKELTALSGGRIFPYRYIEVQSLVWKRVHKLTGIRYRNPYQTRHTHVSWCLMIGENILKVAEQHGHSANMMLTTYAKWMKGGEDVERIKEAMGYDERTDSARVRTV